jgi:alanyl-tRNA synthetase
LTIEREKEYQLDFFKENGFVRKQCIKCKRYFWTLNKDLNTCQDAPCSDYEFIGKHNLQVTIDDVRNSFIEFFKSKNHTYIEPRPVVARWRDDIYLTIASIAVFQPFVTSGEVDPPANPLVISQPCIRLKDLDLVGLTSGRHLTIFEMAAHHAFNSKENYVYWKDETTKYCHELNSSVYKIDPYSVTYIEEFWEGGGNAGPCLEVASKGLEIATLVFMKYKIADGNYVDIPLFIVDTGYGMERYTWYLTGKPTVFHALYGNILEKLLDKIGLSKDDELIFEHARQSILYSEGLIKRQEVIKRIRENLGIKEDISELISKLEALYAILDHTKCIIFMLADGLVPSNSGEGYLGRLLIRKTLKNLLSLEIDIPLIDIINDQIKLWSNFKNVYNSKERIREIIEIEEDKYYKLINRASIEISNLIKNKKAKNERRISKEELIELYDSHGIHPDFVIKEAKKENFEVEFPLDFFSKIVEKHEKPLKQEVKEELPDVEGIETTYPLYYDDPYLFEFNAKVVKTVMPKWIVLDKTAFYPEGGGQIYDTGTIIFKDKTLKVKSVYKKGNVILHEVEGLDQDITGFEVKGIVDKERRLNIMRHHTATHILLYSIRKVLGDHIWQAGARKEEDKARLDVTHYKKIEKEELERIENLANEIVLSGLPVRARFMDRKEAEERYGFKLYQGGVMGGRTIRVVSIDNIDHQACGGTHLSNTSEVGMIKIIKSERIQDGVERFIFTAGKVSLERFRELEKTLDSISEITQTPREKIIESILRLQKDLRKERKEKENLLSILAEQAIKSADTLRTSKVNFYKFKAKDLSSDILIALGEEIIKRDPKALVLLGSINDKVVAIIMLGKRAVESGYRADILIKKVAEMIKGGGGGREDYAQAGGSFKEGLEKAFKEIENIITNQ